MTKNAALSMLVLLTLHSDLVKADEAAREKQKGDFQVIIVGSGYGGSVAAFRLAQLDIDTLVLERGRDWRVTDPRSPSTFATLDSVHAAGGDGRANWLQDACSGNLYMTLVPPVSCPVRTGVLETIDATSNSRDVSPRIEATGTTVVVGAAVGGGSVVNNGITYRPTKSGFDRAFPLQEMPQMQAIWRDLDRKYFDLALARLAPAVPPSDVLATPYYAGTRMLDAIAADLGYPPESSSASAPSMFGRTLAATTVDWDKVRDEIAGRRVPAVIQGDAWWGVNSDAKRTLAGLDGYLGKALATGRVTLKSLHTVTALSYDERAKLYEVHVTQTDEAYNVLSTHVYTSTSLIMAAGSIGTTKLLMHARETGEMPALSEHVGTRWSTNGNTAMLRIFGTSELPQGGPAGLKITDFSTPSNPIVVENLPQATPSYFGQSPDLAPLRSAMMIIGIGVPTKYGAFRYDRERGTIVLEWPSDGALNVYTRLTEILSRMPGQSVPLTQAQAQAVTLHPLGGVPFGLATDEHCEVRGYKRLYAVDGSLLPGAAAVTNPSLFITAMAERCMSEIAARAGED